MQSSSDPTTETILTYEGIAEYYASIEDDPELRESIRGLFGTVTAGRQILEVGCGPGRDAALLRAHGFEVTAIDLCQSFIERGHQGGRQGEGTACCQGRVASWSPGTECGPE